MSAFCNKETPRILPVLVSINEIVPLFSAAASFSPFGETSIARTPVEFDGGALEAQK
jgi:hypothetical protein